MYGGRIGRMTQRALADALEEIEQSEYRLDPSLYQLIDVVGAYVRDTTPDGECVASLITHGPCREEGLALLADLVGPG